MNSLIYPQHRRLSWSRAGNVDNIFNGFFGPPITSWSINKTRIPALDISETNVAYLVKVELPGIRTEDLDVTVKDGVLNIQAEHKENNENTDSSELIRRERQCGKFVRSLNLGVNVDEESIAAEYRDGVLRVTLPKVKEVKPRKVQVMLS